MIKNVIIYLRYFNNYKRLPYWRGDLKKPYGLRATSNVVNYMFTGACAQLFHTPRTLLKA